MATFTNRAALDAAFTDKCPSMDWRISATVLGAFVFTSGLVWHISSVQRGAPLHTAGGGVLLGFFTLAVIAAAVLGATHQAKPDGTGASKVDDQWAIASLVISILITILIVIAFSFIWHVYAKDKKNVSVAWPVTYTFILAASVVLMIGIPVAMQEEGCFHFAPAATTRTAASRAAAGAPAAAIVVDDANIGAKKQASIDRGTSSSSTQGKSTTFMRVSATES